ncbi:MAG TPA: helix-turn-helix domain-containing protein [Candidatus Magasanikbacteria bacterium]|nr:helix-turn-helix domain-containing protein [Candidatus Magasanikbacteria bacterium]
MATNPLIPSPEQKEIIRVSISEAARLFGVNPQTIRRAIRDQEITYVVVAGRYKINFESLVKWSQRKTTVKNKTEKHGIGQFVDKWKISNTLYSPSKKTIVKNEIPPQASIDVLSKPDDNKSKN